MRHSAIIFRDLVLVLLSAALLSLPFHFGFLWPLAFVALIPYFFLLHDQSRGSAVIRSYVFGVLFWVFTGYWLTYVNVFGFALLVAYLALYFALFGYFASRYFFDADARARSRLSFKTGFYLAAGWVFFEWVRSWMLSGLPWTLLGESQWKNLFYIQMADIVGVWGISFFVCLTNYLLYRVLLGVQQSTRGFWLRDLILLISISAIVVGYGAFSLGQWDRYLHTKESRPTIRVSVVQGNIPQDQKWERRVRNIIFEKYKRLTLMCANENPDLIVWPETSFPGILEDEPVMAAQLRSTIRHSQTPTLVGIPTIGNIEEGLRFYNTAILYGTNGEESKRYSKIQLVPFGEYIPLEPLLGFIRHFVDIGHFNPGKEKTIFTIRSESSSPFFTCKYATLICYEDIFPGLVRDFVGRGADFLVNITNDAWFGKTTAPYQHAQGSIFRAVENRVPVIRSTNTGLSCFIDQTGKIYASVQEQGEEIMVTGHRTENVILRKNRTFYTRFGDVFLWLLILLFALAYRESNRPTWT